MKFAVLGCGRIGRMHALNLARHPRAEVTRVYDVSATAASRALAEAAYVSLREGRTVAL